MRLERDFEQIIDSSNVLTISMQIDYVQLWSTDTVKGLYMSTVPTQHNLFIVFHLINFSSFGNIFAFYLSIYLCI